jgi:surface polysaccharide O-acyltransferase-like enzyme
MTKRNVNVDLARVVATILVIVLHVLGQGGILKNASPDGVIYWVAWFLEILSYCAVNCFALISGYVMVNKNAKLKSLIALWFQVIFYSLLITLLFFVFVPETKDLGSLLFSFIPI